MYIVLNKTVILKTILLFLFSYFVLAFCQALFDAVLFDLLGLNESANTTISIAIFGCVCAIILGILLRKKFPSKKEELNSVKILGLLIFAFLFFIVYNFNNDILTFTYINIMTHFASAWGTIGYNLLSRMIDYLFSSVSTFIFMAVYLVTLFSAHFIFCKKAMRR